MKALRTSLITASLLAALAGSALAQMGPGGMGGPGAMNGPGAGNDAQRGARMEQMHARMGQRHAAHMNELKGKLKLEASQEAAWKTFADAMQPPAQAPARPDRAALEKLSTPERLDRMQAFMGERQGQMQKHIEATRNFYASLNAEQKKTFDAETGRFMARMGEQGPRGAHHRH